MLSSYHLILPLIIVSSAGAATLSVDCPTAESSGNCDMDTCTTSLSTYTICNKDDLEGYITDVVNRSILIEGETASSSNDSVLLKANVQNFTTSCIDPADNLNSQINCISSEVAILMDEICDVEDLLDECKDRIANVTDRLDDINDIIDNSNCDCNTTAIDEYLEIWEDIVNERGVDTLDENLEIATFDLETLENELNTSSAVVNATTCNATISALIDVETAIQPINDDIQGMLTSVQNAASFCILVPNAITVKLNTSQTEFDNLVLNVSCVSDGIGPCCDELQVVELIIAATENDIQNLTSVVGPIEATATSRLTSLRVLVTLLFVAING